MVGTPHPCCLFAHPQVTPVTLINTDFALHHYRQNAVSGAYICYGLKQGHVRVLSRSSAVRALLKGHAKPLTDLQFAGGAGAGDDAGGSLLASGAQDGQLFVWQLRLDEGAEAIEGTQKLHAHFTAGGGEPGALRGAGGAAACGGVALVACWDPCSAACRLLSHHCRPCVPPGRAGSAGDVLLSWHTPSKRVLAAGVGGRVLLVGVPTAGMEQLEFDLEGASTPGGRPLRPLCHAGMSAHGGRLLGRPAAVECAPSSALHPAVLHPTACCCRRCRCCRRQRAA